MNKKKNKTQSHDSAGIQQWPQGCSGDVKVSSSLLSSSIFSYPYFVEEDLQTPRTVLKARTKKVPKKMSQNHRKVCNYPSSQSSFMTHSVNTMKTNKNFAKKFHNEEPSAFKNIDKKFYKNAASVKGMKNLSEVKVVCSAMSPIKLKHVLRSQSKKGNDPKSKLTNTSAKKNDRFNYPFNQLKKRKSVLLNENVTNKSDISRSEEKQLALKSSKSCGACDSEKSTTRSCSMTIAKITLNEDDKGVFVPFSWLDKFNAEEIRLRLVRKELSRIPKPIETGSQYYKSRQSTLICKIARAGSI